MRRARCDKSKRPFKIVCFCNEGIGTSQNVVHSLRSSFTGNKERDLIDASGKRFKSLQDWELNENMEMMPKDQVIPEVGLYGRRVQLSIRGVEAALRDRRLTPEDLRDADYIITTPEIVNMRNPKFKKRPELHDEVRKAEESGRLVYFKRGDDENIRRIRREIEKRID